MEAEIISRIDTENKVQGLQEQVRMNEEVFERIISVRRSKAETQKESESAVKLSSISDEYAALYEDQLSIFETESTKIKNRFKKINENGKNVYFLDSKMIFKNWKAN